jgi:hypothetical protein
MTARVAVFLSVAFLCISQTRAASVTLDFEGMSDYSPADNIYALSGITFSSGLVVVSGAFGGSLNESEFPPRSGAGVFLNDADTTTLLFASAITSFQGYFTYGGPLTLNFYNASDVLLTSILTGFSANLALSGDIGSLPNEELAAAVLADATRLDILAPGTDFTLDDVTVSANDASGVPEPATWLLVGAGVMFAVLRRAPRIFS